VKKSGRDESIQVVTYLCMEAMLGIFLHSYLKKSKKQNKIARKEESNNSL
jgi:hypothetical protein